MNQGIVQSSFAQQMAASGSPNWWSINNNMQTPHYQLTHHLTPPLIPPSSWTHSQDLPESWSQQVLGLVGEEDEPDMSHMQHKNLENWEQQFLNHSSINSCGGDVKQENDMFGLSNKSSQISVKCNNSTAAGGIAKRPRIKTSSAQSGIKVRKEKLGDRITALHQLVSPFGKTDTASVLLEAIGYIRFLERQIEALSLPYLNSGSGNMRRQQPLLNENSKKRKAISEQECDEEPKKDLKSRGLCLVPISCTVNVGSENGADFWAPAFGGNFQ